MKKSRLEILYQVFLNKSDIATLLQISRPVADRIYNEADRIHRIELKFRAYPNKVRINSVLKASGTNWNLLLKQIKNADAVPEQSAETE